MPERTYIRLLRASGVEETREWDHHKADSTTKVDFPLVLVEEVEA